MKIPEGQYTVTTLREWLEKYYQTKYPNYSLFVNVVSDDEDVRKEVRLNIFLFFDDFKETWETGKYVSDRDTLVAYCEERLRETKNPHLIARYTYALLAITKNNKYAQKTLDALWKVADGYLSEPNVVSSFYQFFETVDQLIALAKAFSKKHLQSIAQYCHRILNESNFLDLKISLLMIFSEEKGFKIHNIQNLPKFCLDLLPTIQEREHQERILEIALKLSQRINDQTLVKNCAEYLGDIALTRISEYDETNIAISHLNEQIYERAISYYKLAKHEEKLAATRIRLEENRLHHQYPSIKLYVNASTNLQQIIDNLNEQINENLNLSFLEILGNISRNNYASIIPWYNELRPCLTKNEHQFTYLYVKQRRVDAWGNKYKIPHEAFLLTSMFRQMFNKLTLFYLPNLLYKCMKNKKITISQFRKIMIQTGFHLQFVIRRVGEDVTISLYDLLGRGLEEFLIQNNKSIENKAKADWRFCIDFLTTKFEAVIRHIARILSIPIVQCGKDGETQFVTLEKILAHPNLKKVFDDDDIMLFNHTFTKAGLNLRNEVAHGLLLPQDYTQEKALLVFLSVLRLVKISDYIVTQELANRKK